NAPHVPAGCSMPIATIGSGTRGCATSFIFWTQSVAIPPLPRWSAASALPQEREAVADGEQRALDPVVGGNHVVERTHRDGRFVVGRRIGDGPTPERVVDEDQTVRAQP